MARIEDSINRTIYFNILWILQCNIDSILSSILVALEGSRATILILKFYTSQNFTLLMMAQFKHEILNKEEVGLNLAPTFKRFIFAPNLLEHQAYLKLLLLFLIFLPFYLKYIFSFGFYLEISFQNYLLNTFPTLKTFV
ncbi:hypothetical protein [Aliarcobacter cryaerophilus]|uniref:hypothetical protein n=1 Tax=Aliarcobacter cryaerophilus TaxID=28198 RepID=UPI0013DF516A|nr:hypothetical protein [Aliarcobacter cryaerophilus]